MPNRKSIKVLFVLPSLKAGGAERVITTIAKGLNKQDFTNIILVAGYKKDAVYTTDNIHTVFLGKSRVLTAVPSIINHVYKLKPDIVVGSISHVNRVLSFASLLFPKVLFVGREASVSSVMDQFAIKKRKINLFKHAFKNYFKYLDAIICQSQDMYKEVKLKHDIDDSKILTINNPISDGFSPIAKKITNKPIQYITVGSLHPVKGHKRLLNLLSKLDHDFRYTIVGSGDKSLLKDKETLGLSNKINHITHSNKVVDLLAKSDVFICGSYVEGFPNAIIESCAVGIPVVAFQAPGGLKEIIIPGKNGYLVSSEEEFIEKLNYVNSTYPFDPLVVSETVQSRYSQDIIVKQYEKLFKNLINKAAI